MHEIRDGSRTLRFNGMRLGRSSSRRPGAFRWIEFELYRTESGSYVLSRTGVSLVFHGASCPLVNRYHLDEAPTSELRSDAVPCPDCKPTTGLPYVFPEKFRYWAQVSDDAEPVLDALYRYDDESKTRYLTRVAQQVLEEAAEHDPDIDSIYRVEYIP